MPRRTRPPTLVDEFGVSLFKLKREVIFDVTASLLGALLLFGLSRIRAPCDRLTLRPPSSALTWAEVRPQIAQCRNLFRMIPDRRFPQSCSK